MREASFCVPYQRRNIATVQPDISRRLDELLHPSVKLCAVLQLHHPFEILAELQTGERAIPLQPTRNFSGLVVTLSLNAHTIHVAFSHHLFVVIFGPSTDLNQGQVAD